jgi:hypothetical protein
MDDTPLYVTGIKGTGGVLKLSPTLIEPVTYASVWNRLGHATREALIKALGVHLDKSRRKAHATAARAKKVKLRVGVNARLVELEWYLLRRVSKVLLLRVF